MSENGGARELLAVIPFTTEGGAFSYLDEDRSDGTYCYVATAVRANGNESVFSNEACKTIDTLRPNAPTGLAVE